MRYIGPADVKPMELSYAAQRSAENDAHEAAKATALSLFRFPNAIYARRLVGLGCVKSMKFTRMYVVRAILVQTHERRWRGRGGNRALLGLAMPMAGFRCCHLIRLVRVEDFFCFWFFFHLLM